MDTAVSANLGLLAILRQSRRDFLSLPMLSLNILPVLLGVLLWGGIFYSFSDTLIAYIKGFMPESWQLYMQSASSDLFAQGVTVSLYVLLGFCVILLALVGNVFVSIFYAPLVVAHLRKHYYPTLAKPTDSLSFSAMLKNFLKSFVLLCALCIVCAPLLLLPVIGGAIMLVPFFIFFYQSMLYDIGHEVLGVESYARLRKAKGKYSTTLLAYLLGLIPLLNFFTPLLQVIILSHYCFQLRIQSKRESKIESRD